MRGWGSGAEILEDSSRSLSRYNPRDAENLRERNGEETKNTVSVTFLVSFTLNFKVRNFGILFHFIVLCYI